MIKKETTRHLGTNELLGRKGIARGRDTRLTGHENTGHVLVATRNSDHSIQMMATSCRLDLIGDEVSRLERVPHPRSTHANTIAHADCAELVTNNSGIHERLFNCLPKLEDMFVAPVMF